jgi:hypothetical protein
VPGFLHFYFYVLISRVRPVALRRPCFQGVAASIRNESQGGFGSVAAVFGFWVLDFGFWIGPTKASELRTSLKLPAIQNPKPKTQNPQLGPSLCVAGFRRVCLFGPGPSMRGHSKIPMSGERGYPPKGGNRWGGVFARVAVGQGGGASRREADRDK